MRTDALLDNAVALSSRSNLGGIDDDIMGSERLEEDGIIPFREP